MTLLVSLFVTSKNLSFGVFLPRKTITILRKITINFRQVSKSASLSKSSGIFQQNPLKSTCEKVKALKKLYYTWTSSQVAFKASSQIFFTYLQKPVCIIKFLPGQLENVRQARLKVTTSDYKWLQVSTSQSTSYYKRLQVTTSDYKWLWARLRVTTSDYEPDYKWLRVTISQTTRDYEWLRMTASDCESSYEWLLLRLRKLYVSFLMTTQQRT